MTAVFVFLTLFIAGEPIAIPAPAPASPGFLLAIEGRDGKLSLARIGSDGNVDNRQELLPEGMTAYFGWLDAKRLAVLTTDDQVKLYEDGRLVRTIDVWFDEGVDYEEVVPWVSPGGALWVAAETIEGEGDLVNVAVRKVIGSSLGRSRPLPRGSYVLGIGPHRRVRPAAGVTLEIVADPRVVEGADPDERYLAVDLTCSHPLPDSPRRRLDLGERWPSVTITWLNRDPPRFEITTDGSSESEPGRAAGYIYRDCGVPLEGFSGRNEGTFAEQTAPDGPWDLWTDGRKRTELDARWLRFQPATRTGRSR